jgi:hypothetical protein
MCNDITECWQACEGVISLPSQLLIHMTLVCGRVPSTKQLLDSALDLIRLHLGGGAASAGAAACRGNHYFAMIQSQFGHTLGVLQRSCLRAKDAMLHGTCMASVPFLPPSPFEPFLSLPH